MKALPSTVRDVIWVSQSNCALKESIVYDCSILHPLKITDFYKSLHTAGHGEFFAMSRPRLLRHSVLRQTPAFLHDKLLSEQWGTKVDRETVKCWEGQEGEIANKIRISQGKTICITCRAPTGLHSTCWVELVDLISACMLQKWGKRY